MWLKYYILLCLNSFISKRIISALIDYKTSPENKKNKLKILIASCLSSSKNPYRISMKSRRWPTENNEIQIVGLFDFPSGIGKASCYLYNTLSKLKTITVKKINVSGYFHYPGVKSNKKDKIENEGSRTVVFVLNPPQAKKILKHNDFQFIQHKKLINYIWYESNTIPDDWKEPLQFFDGVWVDNYFIKNCISPACQKLKLPVEIRPIAPSFVDPVDMSHLFNDKKVSILNVFNLNSGIFRKNPLAIIGAFNQLPKNIKQKAELIIKTNGDKNSQQMIDLKIQSEQYSFKLINSKMSDEQLSGLIKACDIYISLHRTEGLGLLPLQAMSYGKPVIATGWSGNMSYMSNDSAILIDYQLKTNNSSLKQYIPNMVTSDKALFKENVIYAEPRLDSTIKALEKLILSSKERLHVGEKAKKRYLSYCKEAYASWDSKQPLIKL